MSWFHKHVWTEISRTYAPPYDLPFGEVKMGTAAVQTFMCITEKAACGVTTICFRCSDPACEELKKIEMLGKEISK